MKNIVLTRIDERLLHGQVVVSWIPYLKADEVLIVDDEYANDDFMSLLIKNAAPDNVKVQVLDYLNATDYLNSDDKETRILILLRSVEYLKKLIDSGVVLHKINVGNLSSSPDREQYYNSVYLSNTELNLLKEIAKQSDVEIKMLPNDKSMTLV